MKISSKIQKRNILQFLKETAAKDAMEIGLKFNEALYNMANNLYEKVPGSTGLGAHAALWTVKKRLEQASEQAR